MATVVDVWLGLRTLEEVEALEHDGTKVIELVSDDWNTTLKSKREKVIRGHRKAIPDADAYIEKVVDRSNDAYGKYIEGHPEKDVILLERELTMSLAKDEYRQRVDNAFVSGGEFEKGVDENKDKFMRNIKTVLAVVGYSPYAYGAVEKAKYLFKGLYAIFNDIVEGIDKVEVLDFTEPLIPNDEDIPPCIARMNRYGRQVVLAIAVNKPDSFITDKIATPFNNKISSILNAIKNPNLESLNIKLEKNADLNRWCFHITATTPEGGT